MAKNPLIITIGREYGSGGREVARILSEKLGMEFYDGNLLALAGKEYGTDYVSLYSEFGDDVTIADVIEDEDTGVSATWTAGLRLDSVDALAQMGAFDNRGAFLCVAADSGNETAAMKTLEYLMSDLTEASDAATKAA